MIIEILQGLVICAQGGGYVLPGALTVNDGFKDGSFKFVETFALEQVTVELEQLTKYSLGEMWTTTICLRVLVRSLLTAVRGSLALSREG